MAESQWKCMEDNFDEIIPETKPQFYYSEEQRAALEQLLRNGDGAFKTRLEEDKVKDFISAREMKVIQNTFQEHQTSSEEKVKSASARSKADSGVPSTYWPELSDSEVPPLDIGWPSGGFYKGTTRVAVHTHPPKDNGPFIKEVVRKLIQESRKLLAVVMDLLTDLQILQDLLDAASRHTVSVYVVLDAGGVPHFLDMCGRLEVSALHLQNIRVRSVAGLGLTLSSGKLPGALSSRYMLIDGEKVMFGSYSFTWSSSRVDRAVITVITGQVVEVFDRDFRELYAISENVDLYKEFSIRKAATALPVQTSVNPKPPPSCSSARFQVSLGDPRQVGLQVPAHKFHNPKYSLVVGNSLAGPPQDPPSGRESLEEDYAQLIMQRFLQSHGEEDELIPLPDDLKGAEYTERYRKVKGSVKKKQLSNCFPFPRKKASNRNAATGNYGLSTPPDSSATRKSEDTTAAERKEDRSETLLSKGKRVKSSELNQRSASEQTYDPQNDDESKSDRKLHKKTCTLS